MSSVHESSLESKCTSCVRSQTLAPSSTRVSERGTMSINSLNVALVVGSIKDLTEDQSIYGVNCVAECTPTINAKDIVLGFTIFDFSGTKPGVKVINLFMSTTIPKIVGDVKAPKIQARRVVHILSSDPKKATICKKEDDEPALKVNEAQDLCVIR